MQNLKSNLKKDKAATANIVQAGILTFIQKLNVFGHNIRPSSQQIYKMLNVQTKITYEQNFK